MKLAGIPFQTIDWAQVEPTRHPGTNGEARWRTREVGDVRVRLVEYTAGYAADHWCERGHVLHVLAGELLTELRDGRKFTLHAGQSYVVADGDGAHRSRTSSGATLCIVD
jgi:quercetin dioxygenase-like cupin family protein